MDDFEDDTEAAEGNISTELSKSYSSDVDSSFNFQKSNTESVCNDKTTTLLNCPELVLEFLNSLFIILSKLESTPYSSSSSSSSSSGTNSSSDCVKYEEERGEVSTKKSKVSRGHYTSPPPVDPSSSSSNLDNSIRTTTPTTTPVVQGDSSTYAYALFSQPTPNKNLCLHLHPREPNDPLCKCNKFFRHLFDIASKFKRQNKFTGIDLYI